MNEKRIHLNNAHLFVKLNICLSIRKKCFSLFCCLKMDLITYNKLQKSFELDDIAYCPDSYPNKCFIYQFLLEVNHAKNILMFKNTAFVFIYKIHLKFGVLTILLVDDWPTRKTGSPRWIVDWLY